MTTTRLTPPRLRLLAAAAALHPNSLHVEGSGRHQMAADLASEGLGTWAPPKTADERGGSFVINPTGKRALVNHFMAGAS